MILAAKAIRTFGYGALGVLFPVVLAQYGLGPRGLGGAASLALLAAAVFTLAARRPAETRGPKTVLVVLALLIFLSGVVFIFADRPLVFLLAVLLGNVAVGTGETGPFAALEQVLLSRSASPERLTLTLSLYHLCGFVSAALGAAVVAWEAMTPRMVYASFALGGLLQAVIYARLRSDIPPRAQYRSEPVAAPPLVRRIAALFALDSFAGGFIVQSLVLYWFHARFAMGINALGWIAFSVQMVTGLSYLLAPPLARRFGLVNTMVFSHLISNLILIAVALAPTPGLAVALLLARHTLSQIDVPTRQSFLMSAVKDHERESAASLTNSSRALAQCLSPLLTGVMMQGLALSAPFVVGGVLKCVYDLALYATIRNRTDRGSRPSD